MATYRWLAYDLMTNTALAQLPLSVRKYGGSLDNPGTLEAQMPVEAATAADLMAATIPERTCIYVERDGVILNGYPIWQRTRAMDKPVALAGTSFEALLKRNRNITSLVYAATDQFAVAQGLVNALQAQTGGNFSIQVGTATSGVLRDRTYLTYERKNLGDALEELASVDNGFSWSIDCAWDSAKTAPQRILNLSYPRRGRIAGSTGVVFVTGKNILDYEFLEDGTRSARVVDALGAGDGKDMLISTSSDTALLAAGYPLTAESLSFKDIQVQATLDAHAIAARKARATTPTFLTLTISPDDVDAGLGTWIVGDDVLVQITDTNFPRQADGTPGHQAYYRLLAYEVDVPDTGPELVNVTLGTIQ